MGFFEKIISGIELFVENTGYWGFFILMLIESTSIPVFLPAELVLLTAGYFVGIGKFNFLAILLVCTFGSLAGAVLNYILAYFLGRKLLDKYGKYIFLNKARLEKFEIAFNKHNGILTFIGRLLPFIKHIVSIPPGLSKMNFIKFSLCTIAGAGLLSAVTILLGVKIGENINNLESIKRYLEFGSLVFVLLILIIYYLYSRFVSKCEQSSSLKKEQDNNG